MKRFTKIFLLFRLPLIAVFLLIPVSAFAEGGPKYLFKVATLAPEGSVWMKRFREFTQEVSDKTNGEAGFKIYSGGVMGDDRSMYRKMQIGQLHGGGFTMTGIGNVVPDFRVMGVPFLFRSYEEVDRVQKGLWPFFQRAFEEKDLVLMAMSEVGFIYTMSTSPITTLEELRKRKSWAPEGDPVSMAYLDTIGVTPTPLSILDVLSSLQTGLIDTVYNAFYGSIVLQWFTKARYISDVPFGYAYGAFLLDRKSYSRLPPEYKAVMESAADKHFGFLLRDTRKSNAEALDVLKKNGVELVNAAPGEYEKLKAFREETVKRLVGKAFSGEIYEAAMKYLNDSRNGEK